MKQLQFSLIELCQSLTSEGDWQTAKLQLAGNRFARLIIANTGNAYSIALRAYDKDDKVIEHPILTFDVLREKLCAERVESIDKDTLYLVIKNNRDCLSYEEKAKLEDLIDDIINKEKS